METVWHMQERQAGRQAGGRAQMLDRIGRAHTPKFFLLPPVVSNSVRERKTLALAEREKRETNVPFDCFSEPVDKEDGDGG